MSRYKTQAALRRLQLEAQARKIRDGDDHRSEGVTDDDIVRMYGVLIALEKLSAQLQLFGTILLRDPWLRRSQTESWWQRRLRILHFS